MVVWIILQKQREVWKDLMCCPRMRKFELVWMSLILGKGLECLDNIDSLKTLAIFIVNVTKERGLRKFELVWIDSTLQRDLNRIDSFKKDKKINYLSLWKCLFGDFLVIWIILQKQHEFWKDLTCCSRMRKFEFVWLVSTFRGLEGLGSIGSLKTLAIFVVNVIEEWEMRKFELVWMGWTLQTDFNSIGSFGSFCNFWKC